MSKAFDVIVVGGGHAGCEAAAAAARMGARTALLTHKLETIGVMSCNPAIGGLGKGHLVREIDALDGLMGRVIDRAGIQFRMLNASKGPAVRGPRAQADRKLYKEAMQAALQGYPNLTLIEGAADDLDLDKKGAVQGVKTLCGNVIKCRCVVLTTGTFLRGIIHRGEEKIPAGRLGEKPTIGLAETLERLDFPLGRLKTGTPPRLDGQTIDWPRLKKQPGDETPQPFSYITDKIRVPQIDCHIAYTNAKTHEIIRDNLHRSAMYAGRISGPGPRYCPSIEDKISRFADKARHQIFLEPEGLEDDTVYPNGISTSLPADVQEAYIRSIEGLERVKIKEYGYAIEYDYIDPRSLRSTLETRKIPRLFLAGQINGTTGYEEAAAQGLMAGINAALQAGAEDVSRETIPDGFILDRSEAYIGVLIDDLITRGTPEPYRMFTSRAEYRLKLRADNADQRLTDKGIAIGCVDVSRETFWKKKAEKLERARTLAAALVATPNELKKQGVKVNMDGVRRSVSDLLGYQDISWPRLEALWPALENIEPSIKEQLEFDALYAGYMKRHEADIEAFRKDENLKLPPGLDYKDIGSLSAEARQKLERARPETLGAASRIPGVTPAAVIALLRHVKRGGKGVRRVSTKALQMSPEEFRQYFPVSRETFARLKIYHDLLLKWQNAFNLVGPGTLDDIWGRHFADSAQILALLSGNGPDAQTLYDFGSGAGFPGLVLAIMAADLSVHCIDSDARKCEFLKTVARETGTKIYVHNARLERLEPRRPDYITARALAPLTKLLDYCAPWAAANPGVKLIFLKGAAAQAELETARESFDFEAALTPSRTNENAGILCITGLKARPGPD